MKLSTKQISRFTDHLIINKIDFTAQAGEIHAIIGNNGEGKTTFARILAGILMPTSGSIFLDGKETVLYDIHTARNLGIYMVQQNIQLFPCLSIRDNLINGNERILFSSRFFMPSQKAITDFCKNILELYQLDFDLDAPVSSLGEGKQRLLQLVRILICKPKVLILDEFSASFTQAESRQIFKQLAELKKTGASIILITQNPDEVTRYCDHVSVFNNGMIEHTYNCRDDCFDSREFLDKMQKMNAEFLFPRLNIMPGRQLLEVSHISTDVIQNISFTLREGDSIGIAGLVGSGRTTLLKAITGLLKIQKGVIRFEPPLNTASISIVPENSADASLFCSQSVSFNITASNFKKTRKHKLISYKKMDLYARDFVDRLGLGTLDIRGGVSRLSMGTKQKLIIARSLFNHTKIYIFDEPSKNLDPAGKLELYNLMNALRLNNAAIILISSDFSELIEMCNYVILLKDGRQIDTIPAQKLTIEDIYQKLNAEIEL